MASLGYESTRYSDVIAHEYAPELAFCRDVITVYEGSEVEYQIGTVLGKVTGTGKYKRVEATATDGSQKAAAIYVGGVTPQTSYNKSTIAATTNTSVVAIVRGNALYKKQGLVFGASVDTQAELDAAYAQLEDKGILAVERIGTFATIG